MFDYYIVQFYILNILMNFKKTDVYVPKKPLFPGYEYPWSMSSSKRSVSFLTLFLVIVGTFLLAFGLFKYSDRFFSTTELQDTWFVVWSQVSLSWTLLADWDLLVYTHSLLLQDTTVFWLKSRSLDLHQYTGFVEIQGTIEKEHATMFIVEVSAVSGSLVLSWTDDSLVATWAGTYISKAWLYLPQAFFQKYTLLNNWENNVLSVKNNLTNQVIPISYFVCTSTNPNRHCSQLKHNISSSAEKVVTSSQWEPLYKLESVTSWFFSNGNYYGYFINDVIEKEVVDLVNTIVVPTESYVKNTLFASIQSLCADDKTSLMQIQNHSFGIDTNWFFVTLQGPTVDWSASCKLFIDPSLAVWAKKISYITNTASVSENSESSSRVEIAVDPTIKQFPINIEKSLTFTSSRWYSLVFPSSNVAYEAMNINDDLWLPGVRCSSQMNITKFADKETIHEDPKISIFTCNIKWTLNNLWTTFIQKESENGIKFIIQIKDSAWMDFATHIQIQ